MASVRALLLVAVLPPLAVLLAVALGRAAARSVIALARAHFAWPAGSLFMYVPSPRRKHASKVAPEQLEHELRVSLYRRRTGGEAAEAVAVVECAFCLNGVEEGDEVRELRCRHLFHRACLDRWLARPAARCPLCRSRLVTTTPPSPAALPWEEEEDDDDDDDMALLMAYMGSTRRWFSW